MKSLNKRKIISNFLIVFGVYILASFVLPLVKDEVWYYFKQLKNQVYKVDSNIARIGKASGTESEKNTPTSNYSVFGRIMGVKSVTLTPVNTDFSLVIEKIGVNVPIVSGVLVSDPSAYSAALKEGVAQALVSDLPSKDPGNVFLFAHSSINFWELGKYATTFNLLRKLSLDDPIYVFYRGKTFLYKVVNKETVPGWSTYPLTRKVIEPVLTLQTCDPPGTTFNRLIITAKLYDYSSKYE